MIESSFSSVGIIELGWVLLYDWSFVTVDVMLLVYSCSVWEGLDDVTVFLKDYLTPVLEGNGFSSVGRELDLVLH
jgi:hypothetical protein